MSTVRYELNVYISFITFFTINVYCALLMAFNLTLGVIIHLSLVFFTHYLLCYLLYTYISAFRFICFYIFINNLMIHVRSDILTGVNIKIRVFCV